MLTNYNRSIKYLVIFIVSVPISVLLIRPLVASSDIFIFLSIILTALLLFLWRPKILFLISVCGIILFYQPFLMEVLSSGILSDMILDISYKGVPYKAAAQSAQQKLEHFLKTIR